MQRISVIGCPGAGKSVFSAKLHRITKLPLINLDSIYHDPNGSYKTDKNNWNKKIEVATSGSKWIIDGDFNDTFKARFEASDTIIFLDFPTYICLYHAILRRLNYRFNSRPEMPKNWKERLPLEFVGYILTYRKNELPKTHKQINKWNNHKNVLIFRNQKQADEYLQSLKTSQLR
jgi:adenylate kinase family enzyme